MKDLIITFFIYSSIYLVISYFIAICLKSLLKRFSVNVLVLLVWATLVNVAFAFDYLEISKRYFAITVFIGCLVPVGYAIWKKGFNKIKSLFLANGVEFIFNLILWGIAVGIMLLPLFKAFPADSIITGHFVSNDSVNHAVFAEGYAYTRARGLDAYFNNSYPRGYHSLIFYTKGLLFKDIDTQYLLLPATIFGYSMMVFVVGEFLKKSKLSFFAKSLIKLSPFIPFLVTSTIYTLFIPQIVSIPLVILGMILIYDIIKDSKYHARFLLVLMVFLVAVFNIYGVFSLSVDILAAVVFFVFKITHEHFYIQKIDLKHKWKRIRETFFTRHFLFIILIAIIIAIPSLLLTKNILFRQTTSGTGSDLITSYGNLSGGFVSSTHLTGFWVPDRAYRDNLDGVDSKYSYLALGLLIIQISCIVLNKKKRDILFLVPLFILLGFFTFVISNPYLQFKIFTYLVPVFQILFLVNLSELVKNKKFFRQSFYILITLYIAFMIWFPLKSYKLVPVVQDNQFKEIKELKRVYFNNGKTLMLTLEDWVPFYIDDKDDYIPLTQYLNTNYNNQDLDFVIIDKGYETDDQAFLETRPVLLEILNYTPQQCIANFTARYVIYNLNCE